MYIYIFTDMHRERERVSTVTSLEGIVFLGSYPKILFFPGGECEYNMYTVHLHMFMSHFHWHIVLCAQYLWIYFQYTSTSFY